MVHRTLVVQIRDVTLETLFAKKCWRGEAIRLELLCGNPGGLELTLKQIRAALRAAMIGCPHPVFVLTFKTVTGASCNVKQIILGS